MPAKAPRVLTAQESSSQEDWSLVRAYVRGDERAFTRLYGKHHARMKAFVHQRLYRWGGVRGEEQQALTDDVVQEMWVRVHRFAPRLRAQYVFTKWLYTVTANLCRNALRDRNRKRVVRDYSDEGLADDQSTADGAIIAQIPTTHWAAHPDRQYDVGVLRRRLDEELNSPQLPAVWREVVQMRLVEGLPYQTIAESLGISVGTVKSRLHRARIYLAAALEDLRRE